MKDEIKKAFPFLDPPDHNPPTCPERNECFYFNEGHCGASEVDYTRNCERKFREGEKE